MLELLREKQTVWERLKQTEKPVVLYGMGDGALKIMAALKKYEIPLAGIFASDEFVRGHSFEGYPVRSFSQTKELYRDFVIVLAFGTFREPLLSYLYQLSEAYEMVAPDVPVILDGPISSWCEEPGSMFDLEYVKNHEEELDQVYQLLVDTHSQKVMRSILDYKISGKLCYLKEATSPMEEVYTSLICPGREDVYVDLGAYTGDTVEEFVRAAGGACRQIWAMEPDRKNYQKLLKRAEAMGLTNITAVNAGSYDRTDTLLFSARAGRNSSIDQIKGKPVKVDSVDHLLGGASVSVIKFDVEGAEEKSILGCEQTIRRYRPRLMVSAYHRNSDLFKLPLLIRRMNPDYRFYLRHHPYIPAWETNFYMI